VIRSLLRRDPAAPKRVRELELDVWKRIIIVPLKDSMSKLLLDEFEKARYKLSITTPLNNIAVILESLVEVQKYGNKYPPEVSIYIYLS